MLLYTFYQPIFYATHDQHFPSDGEERAGYWVGFDEHCGDSLTHKVLDAETFKIIHRSALRHRNLKNPNKRLDDDGGEEDHQPHEKPTKHLTPDPSDTLTVYIKFVEFWGLLPLIPLLQCVNRLGFEICSVN